MDDETMLLIGVASIGTSLGVLSRWGPLSGWAALAFSIVLAPAGFFLCIAFC